MTRHTISHTILTAVLMALVACGPSGDSRGGPGLVEVGVVVLEEPPTGGGLTLPSGFAMGPDGTLYITDARSGLVGFAPDGRFLRRFGAIGDGPGEYRLPMAPWVPDDSTLLVADMNRFSLTAFDRVSGGYRERQEGVGATLSLRSNGRGLLLGMVVPPFNFALRLLPAVTSSAEDLAVLPAANVGQAAGALNVALAASGEEILAGAGLSNRLLRLRETRVMDTLEIPIRHRRGVPEDLAGRFTATERGRWITLYSTQWAAAPLADGFIIVHVELDPLDEPVSPPRPPFAIRSLLTVMSDDLALACPDLPLPISPDLHPFVASRGDTLLVLDHHDTGADIQTVVRKFLVRTDGCDWQPVQQFRGQ